MMVISQSIRSIFRDIFTKVLLLCALVSAQETNSFIVSGDNVCTAIVSFTKVQKVPITGIQTKIARYVTRCGLGILQCSRYRVIYVPAYRELTSTMYRTDQVCCKGYDLIDKQCLPSVSNDNTSGTLTTTKSPHEPSWAVGGSITLSTRNGTEMVRDGTRRNSDKFPSLKNVPRVPPLVDNTNFPQSTAEGKGYLDGNGNVFTIDERNYDVAPDIHKNPHGTSIISVAIGVGVTMSLTGVLVGMAIMKIRFRKRQSLDAMPLTRNKQSRKATRGKSRPLSGIAKKHQTQHDRVVSYVSVQDIRENLTNPGLPHNTKNVPQCSLPRIPEASKEPSENSLQERTESARSGSPPYASINKVKASTENQCRCDIAENDRISTGSRVDSVCIGCSDSGYAKINIVSVMENSTEVSTSDKVKNQQETSINSLYAKVNKNKNSNNEDRRRFSLGILKTNVDDSVYGKLDRPASLYSCIKSKENSMKYDHLKRTPRPPGNSRKTNGTSELYEAV